MVHTVWSGWFLSGADDLVMKRGSSQVMICCHVLVILLKRRGTSYLVEGIFIWRPFILYITSTLFPLVWDLEIFQEIWILYSLLISLLIRMALTIPKITILCVPCPLLYCHCSTNLHLHLYLHNCFGGGFSD